MDRLTENFGFGIIPRQVMKDSTLSLASKGLYCYLCAYAGNKDTAFPSISLITYELKISKDTFYKYMNELKERLYIETCQAKVKGQFSHSVYRLLPCPKSSDTELSYTETSCTENVETNINSIKKNSIKKNKVNKEIAYTLEFEEWYNSYPNRFNKEQTFSSWKKLIKIDTKENIISATMEYKKYLKTNRVEAIYMIQSTNFIGQKQKYKGYLKETTPQTIKPKLEIVEVAYNE